MGDDGWIRVYEANLKSHHVIHCSMATTAEELTATASGLIGSRSPWIVERMRQQTERKLHRREFPLQTQTRLLMQLGYTAAEARLEGKEDHTYLVQYVLGHSVRLKTDNSNDEPVVFRSVLKLRKKKDEKVFCMLKGKNLLCLPNPESPATDIIKLIGAKLEKTDDEKKQNEFLFHLTPVGPKQPTYTFNADTDKLRTSWIMRLEKVVESDENELNLTGLSLHSMPQDIVTKNPNTTALVLTRNFLGYDSGRTITGFRNLTKIHLIDNMLTEFPMGILECINVNDLDLGQNYISSVPADIQRLQDLKTFAMHANQLETLPMELQRLSIRTIVLSFNQFVELPHVVPRMKSLKRLFIAGNQITQISDADAAAMQNLIKLDLRDNHLYDVPPSLCALPALGYIDLTGNKCAQLPQHVLHMAHLETLKCPRNELYGAFESALHGLKDLQAQQNQISSFVFLDALPENLKTLNLSDNELTELPEALAELPALETLLLKNNKLTSLPRGIFTMKSLKWLYVGYNQLPALPTKFKACKVQILEAQHNRLTGLPQNIFRMMYMLRKINLSHNRLEKLPFPPEVEEYNIVEEMHLAENALGNGVIDRICSYTRMRVLGLSNNGITEISKFISKMSSIEVLYLSGNSIAALPKEIKDLKKLEYLMCASNRLKDLPALPDSIKHIDLAGNRLVHVPKPLEKLKNMQILDLSGNYAMNAEKAFASADLSGCAALQQLALIGVPHSLGVTVVVHSRVGPRSVKMDKGGFACRGAWTYGHAEVLGRRPQQEDASMLEIDFKGNPDEILLGVFDGHSGYNVSRRARDLYPNRFQAALKDEQGAVDRALRSSFYSTHRSLGLTGLKEGTTAAVVYANRDPKTGETWLYAANVGDTEVVMSRGGEVEVLTCKHGCDQDKERQRIIMLNGYVSDDLRVNGILATTRCLGDMYMHPFVIPAPTVARTDVQVPTDEFLILACDGLWDVMTYEMAVRIVRFNPDAVQAAAKLRDLAYEYGSEDNITVVVLRFGTIPLYEDYDADFSAAIESAQQLAQQGGDCMGPQSFQYVRQLGQGAFGTVVLARDNKSQLRAVKALEKNGGQAAADLAEEIAVERAMMNLRHPNIVTLYGAFETPNRHYLVMEYLGGGSIAMPSSPKEAISEKRGKFYSAQLSAALRFLHRHDLIYRDMSLKNFLFDTAGNIKIADFGLACSEADASATDYAGTPGYMAPEMVLKQPYGKLVDWWGLGVAMYSLMIGRPPFFADNIADIKDQICNAAIYFPHSLSRPAKMFLMTLLERDPRVRLGNGPDEMDVVGHPFFKGIKWDKLEAGKESPPCKMGSGTVSEDGRPFSWT